MLWWPPDVSTSRGDPKVNKFKQVFSNGHHMLLAGVPCLMTGVLGLGRGAMSDIQEGQMGLGSEVQCIMRVIAT